MSRLVMLVLLVGCGGAEAPKPAKVEAPPACSVAVDKLAGTAWVYQKPTPEGDKLTPLTRVRFREDAGALKADYSASSLSAMYPYDCSITGKIADCWEADHHAKEWCRAWAATHGGTCDAAALSALPNVAATAEEIEKVRPEVEKEFKGMKGEELRQTNLAYNSPNNKIRGHFQVAVNPKTCNITLVDHYITLVDGKVNEFENQIGAATFVETKEAYLWEKCEDLEVARAVVPEGATARAYPAGTYEFESTLPAGAKVDPSCTYTADIWKNWLLLTKDVAGVPKDKTIRWSLQVPLTEKGPTVIDFDRYKVCNGNKERIGLSCAKLHIE